ncbi:MAG: extracellular solute-binding protein [bacterium]|nr:extracellular solute-binding protein [bacterium]
MDSKIKLILIGVGVVVLIIILAVLGVIPGLKKSGPPAAQINFWGLEEEDFWEPVIAKFEEKFPRVSVKYKKLSPTTYEDTLLNSLAEAAGPDIFVVKNTWLAKYKNKIYPLPQQYFNYSQGSFRKDFVNVTEELITPEGQILGLPVFVDTPVLLYNRDLFNAAGIAKIPGNWEEVLDTLSKLNKRSSSGELTGSAIALGASKNISNSFEIINSLIFQFGDKIYDSAAGQFDLQEGAEKALSFYTSFADSGSPNYSWASKFGQSLDAFTQEKTVMAIAMASDLSRVRAKNPHLNFDVLPFPQPRSIRIPVVYANYLVPIVSNFSPNVTSAWEFLSFVALGDGAAIYKESSGLPPARRDLLSSGTSEEDKIFGRQALIAKTWPVSDEKSVKKIFEETVETINSKSLNVQQAVSQMLSQLSFMQP